MTILLQVEPPKPIHRNPEVKQGREAAQREALERTTSARVGYGRDPLSEHDFAALELRVLALEVAGQLPDDWIIGSRTCGVWAGTGPSLQNLPRCS